MAWDASPELIARLRASIKPLEPATELKSVLAHDFPETCSNLPISGGWGRAKERAIVLVPSPASQDVSKLEELVAKHIIYEELIVFRPFDDRFNGIIVTVAERRRVANGSKFDHVRVQVTCWSEAHWQALANEVIKHDQGRAPTFDSAAFVAMREAAKVTYERDFWFDVGKVD